MAVPSPQSSLGYSKLGSSSILSIWYLILSWLLCIISNSPKPCNLGCLPSFKYFYWGLSMSSPLTFSITTWFTGILLGVIIIALYVVSDPRCDVFSLESESWRSFESYWCLLEVDECSIWSTLIGDLLPKLAYGLLWLKFKFAALNTILLCLTSLLCPLSVGVLTP